MPSRPRPMKYRMQCYRIKQASLLHAFYDGAGMLTKLMVVKSNLCCLPFSLELFTMLARHRGAARVTNFRPIASAPLFCRFFFFFARTFFLARGLVTVVLLGNKKYPWFWTECSRVLTATSRNNDMVSVLDCIWKTLFHREIDLVIPP